MTNVTLDRLYDGYLFSCAGHAGYAAKGKDVVCAGVSALCMALLERLAVLCDEGVAEMRRLDVREGEVTAEFGYVGEKREDLLLTAAVETVMAGLRAIAARYPEHVAVDE